MATPAKPPTRKESKVPFAGGRYLLSHRLGNGSFGDIFEGSDTKCGLRVAVKLEKKKVRYPQLQYEFNVYRVLHRPPVGVNEVVPPTTAMLNVDENGDPLVEVNEEDEEAAAAAQMASVIPFFAVGIPQIYYYDSEGDYNIMVMELCGPSLEDLFNYCHRRFSLKTVLMLAEQMLHRIQCIHERGFIHRDIKPENFTMGCGKKAHILYVIDFGLSKLYWNCQRNMHNPFVEGKALTGTARYCSANTHRGYEQSRRDDLESIGFLLVYFLKGSLPWQGIQAKDQQLKTIRIGEKKISTTLEDLCKGLPSEFLKYCQYCRELSFQQKPDYDYFRNLFRSVAQQYGYLLKSPASPTTATAAAKDSSSFPGSNGITMSAGSTFGGNGLNPVSAIAINSSGTGSNISAPGGVLSLEKEPSHKLGFYDWQFDWLVKREAEVIAGLEQRQIARAALEDARSELRTTPPIGTHTPAAAAVGPATKMNLLWRSQTSAVPSDVAAVRATATAATAQVSVSTSSSPRGSVRGPTRELAATKSATCNDSDAVVKL